MADNLETCVDPYLESFARSFAAASYSATTIANYQSVARKLGHLMDAEGITPSALYRGTDLRQRFAPVTPPV